VSDEPKKTAEAPGQNRMQALLDRLWADKTALGGGVRKAAKDMFPDISLPEDAAEVVVAPLKAELDDTKKQLQGALERLAAREKAEADLKTEQELGLALANARAKYNLTDAGYQKMLDRMNETKNVTDPEAAAAWVMSQLPKPEPVSTPSWLPEPSNLFGAQKREEQWEALHKNPRQYLDDQLREFVRDPDKYTAETLGTA
jgi:hypothetical protein